MALASYDWGSDPHSSGVLSGGVGNGHLLSVAGARRSGADRFFGFGLRLQCHPDQAGGANAAWAEVQNQYQRRADLVPNLVATVQGFAKQEKDVFVQVTEARAKATSIHLDANDLTDPAKVKAAAGCAKRAVGRARATAGGQRKLSRAQIEREFSRAAIPA